MMRANRKVTVRVSGDAEDSHIVLLVLAKELSHHGIQYSSKLPKVGPSSRNMTAVQQAISDMVEQGVIVELIQE